MGQPVKLSDELVEDASAVVPFFQPSVNCQLAIRVVVDGKTATFHFTNGATLFNVTHRDLLDDSGCWNH